MLLVLLLLCTALAVEDEENIRIRSNDPNFCRCGEMRTRDAPEMKSIDVMLEPEEQEYETVTVMKKEDTSVVKQYSSGHVVVEKNSEVKPNVTNKDFEPYQPKERPWIVIIRLEKGEGEDEDYVECTGSLITMKWVITSKGCICWDKFGCDMEKMADKIDRNYIVPAMYYNVPADVKRVNASDFDEYRTINYVENPTKNVTGRRNDIVLLEMASPFNHSSQLMPICLPQGDFIDDENVEVFILGFNFHFHKKVPTGEKCTTVGGPRQKAKCKHFLRKHDETAIKGCSFIGPYRSPECVALKKYMNWPTLLPADVDKVTVEVNLTEIDEEERKSRFKGYEEEIASIDCFNEDPGEYGWCGTCLSEAKKGHPGYCGEDQAEEGDDLYQAELARPSEFGGWGFCDKLCQTAQNPGFGGEPVLLEMLRLVKNHEDCREHMHLNISSDFMHMCLQTQQVLHKKMIYRKKPDNTFVESEDRNTKRRLSDPPKALTSIGDAGAPIFKIIKQKDGRANAVLVGVMSTNQYKPMVAKDSDALQTGEDRNIKELITRVKPMMTYIRNLLKDKDSESCEEISENDEV